MSDTNGKGKKPKKTDDEVESGAEGVVYRISREKIVIAVDGGKQIDLPERLRLYVFPCLRLGVAM